MAAKPGRSPRDQLRANDAALKFYAAAADKEVPAHLLNNLPPKRDKVKRPVDGRPVGPSEHQVQCAVISWWALVHRSYNLPHFALVAIPNGGARDVIAGARLKAEGVRRGTPDLLLAARNAKYAGLFVEMKIPGGRISEEQDAFLEYLNNAGYKAVVHWSSESAIQEIKDYLA